MGRLDIFVSTSLFHRRNLTPSSNIHSAQALASNGLSLAGGTLSIETGEWVGLNASGQADDAITLANGASNVGLIDSGDSVPFASVFPVWTGGTDRRDANYGITVPQGLYHGRTTGFVADVTTVTALGGAFAGRPTTYRAGLPLTLVSDDGATLGRSVLVPAKATEYVVAICEGTAVTVGSDTMLPFTTFGAGFLL